VTDSCQPTAAPPRKARRTGAAGVAAVQCSERVPRTMMVGAQGRNAEMPNRGDDERAGLLALTRRHADGEVVRGNMEDADSSANGDPSQVITRAPIVSRTGGSVAKTASGDQPCALERYRCRRSSGAWISMPCAPRTQPRIKAGSGVSPFGCTARPTNCCSLSRGFNATVRSGRSAHGGGADWLGCRPLVNALSAVRQERDAAPLQ
jgi:hypothetical protein